jgi:hypothetical protein
MLQALRPDSIPFCAQRMIICLAAVFTLLGSDASACPEVSQDIAAEQIFEIVSCGDIRSLDDYAKAGGDLDIMRNGHHTALWSAIVGGRIDMASRLINLGADVNAGKDAPVSALIGSLLQLRSTVEDRELIGLINEFADVGTNFDIRSATGNHLLINAIAAICEIPALGTTKDLNRIASELRPHRVSLNENDRMALDHLRTLSALGLYDSNCLVGFAGGPINDG